MRAQNAVILCALGVASASAYLPVFMMHGVGSGAGEMANIATLAAAAHPGTVLTSLPLYEGLPAGLTDLNTQAAAVAAAIRAAVAANATLYEDGYHVVCKSQGALICRAALMRMDDHRARHFVSLAGPQAGVFGAAFFAKLKIPFFENVTAAEAWRVAYTWPAQKLLSIANMWRDPSHLDDYAASNQFLPAVLEAAPATARANFARLERAVFCVGSGPAYDGGIEPWQTAVFGAADGPGGAIRPMADQAFYGNDTFGLRTLDESGRLNLTVVPNATHGDWTGNAAIIAAYVLPHLT